MSNKNIITVSPTPIILPPKYITNFSYIISDFELFSYITFDCKLYDSDGVELDSKKIEINCVDYENWSNDDSYIIHILSLKLGLTPYPNLIKKQNNFFKVGYDLSGNILKFSNLTVDSSGNILLPDGFNRDINTNAIQDKQGNPIQYKFLRYDVDGNPIVFQNIILDPSNNPILPSGYIIDKNGNIRDSNGVHVVIVI